MRGDVDPSGFFLHKRGDAPGRLGTRTLELFGKRERFELHSSPGLGCQLGFPLLPPGHAGVPGARTARGPEWGREQDAPTKPQLPVCLPKIRIIWRGGRGGLGGDGGARRSPRVLGPWQTLAKAAASNPVAQDRCYTG